MDWLSGLLSLFGGGTNGKGVVGELTDAVDRFITTDAEKAEAEMAITQVMHQRELEMTRIALEADKEFNDRIKDLEGTSKDLIQAGFFGKVVLFVRGAQRPAWGIATMILDYMVFSGAWKLEGDTLNDAFYVVNFLVLGFLFGERAIKNVAPYLKGMAKKT